MNYWLLKSEPKVYSLEDLLKDGKTCWDRVTNNTALKNIRSIHKGDLAFIYHTGDEKQIIGIAEVDSDPYPDPKELNIKLVVFDIKPVRKLTRIITLAQIKSDKFFKDFALVKQGRLSVVPVAKEIWEYILDISETKHI
ncbi:MAG TPA: EVE domain-containing protein [Ignavibacteria bacterium]